MSEQFIISLLLSGALGYLNYSILAEMGEISSVDTKEDKLASWILFSIFDYIIYLIISGLMYTISKVSIVINDKKTIYLKFDKHTIFIISILLTIFIIILTMRKFAPPIYRFSQAKNNSYRNKKELAEVINQTPREAAFDSKYLKIVYIFDFENNFIVQGQIKNFSVSLNLEHQLLLQPNDANEYTEQEVKEIVCNQKRHPDNDIVDSSIFIDSKNRLKYYIISYEN